MLEITCSAFFEVFLTVFVTFLQKVVETYFLRFFLSVLGNFSHKVVRTWIVFHERWHTTLFDIYYWVEIVRIKKNSHILEIIC